MVRCSLKRMIKILFSLFIVLILQNHLFSSSSHQKTIFFKKNSPLRIVILSPTHSKIISRLILFFNELRLSYEYYPNFNENISQSFIDHRPSLIILDIKPKENLHTFVTQFHIRLLIVFNEQCSKYVPVKYSEMLLENVTYPTIDFHRDELIPIVRSTASPFRIQPSNPLIQLLTFKDILPIFRLHRTHCIGLPINHLDQTVIYVKNRLTLEKINLLVLSSDQNIQISECLFHHWFIWPVLMDILRYVTSNQYDYHGWIRHIQIDIDDVFLGGKTHDRWTSNDIQALIRSQLFIRNYVKNFQYRLGFSGFYYEENDGDRALMSNSKRR